MSDSRDPDRVSREAGGPFRLSNWPVVAKVAVVLAIPVLLATGGGVVKISAEASDAGRYAVAEKQTTILPPMMSFLGALEVLMSTQGTPPPEAVTRYKESLAAVQQARPAAELSPTQNTAVDTLLAMRSDILTRPVNPGTAASIEAITRANDQVKIVLTGIADEQPVSTVETAEFTDLLTARTALLSQKLLDKALAWSASTADRVALAQQVGIEGEAISRLTQHPGTAAQLATLTSDNAARLTAVKDDNFGGDLPAVASSTAAYDAVAAALAVRMTETAAASASAARNAALRDAGLIIGLLVPAVIIAAIVARSLVRPLRTVRSSVVDIASRQLPDAVRRMREGNELPPAEPIPVASHEEIGQLARAVDDMHEQARRLAGEQAQLRTQISNMFETLSRRSTSLVNQQLSLIERLERDEDDPGRLDSLFQLDHLAARMRRNGDSLLVLAGTRNRGSQAAPLSLADTLRAAVSEVQDYRRVVIKGVPEHYLEGRVATDLVHLFAELIDNALAFSPPDAQVVLSGRSGHDDGVLIEVADSGLGMPDEDRELLNTTLRIRGEVTPEAARHMGLFVVSRLAAAHEVLVRLERNAGGGTVASVLVPADLLAARPSDVPAAPRAAIGPARTRPPVTPSPVAPVVAASSAPAPAPSTTDPAPTRVNGSAARPAAAGDGQTVQPKPLPQRRSAVPASEGSSPTGPKPLPQRRPDTPVAATPSPTPSPAAPKPLPRRQPAAEARGGADVLTPDTGGGANGDGAAPPRRNAADPQGASAFLSARTRLRQELRGPESVPVEPAASTDLADTPIFRQLRSQWLDSHGADTLPWGDPESDDGWTAADRASKTRTAGTTTSGLPRRRPGAQLVPGGVSTRTAGSAGRDPQQIRERLDRHLAGVRRGRAEAGAAEIYRPRHGLSRDEDRI